MKPIKVALNPIIVHEKVELFELDLSKQNDLMKKGKKYSKQKKSVETFKQML